MRKTITIEESIYNRFIKTNGKSHNEKMLKMLIERNKTLTEEENVFKIINKMFIESNNILEERLKAIDKIIISTKNIETEIMDLSQDMYETSNGKFGKPKINKQIAQ